MGTETEKFGQLQAGDRVDAWIFPNGQAKTLMILRSGAIMRAEREQQKSRSCNNEQRLNQSRPDLRSLPPGSSVEAGHLVRGMMAVLASASLGATPVPQQGQVEGEVLQVFPSVIVIKNEEGLASGAATHTAHAGERHLEAGRQDRRLYIPLWSIVRTTKNEHGAHAVGVTRNLRATARMVR